MHCVAIKALWQEDRNEGFGIELLSYEGDDLNPVVEIIDRLVVQVASTDEAKDRNALAEYFTWVGHNKDRLDQYQRMQAVVMVAYAEEQELMASDEHNGIIYIYENNGEIICDRKDQE